MENITSFIISGLIVLFGLVLTFAILLRVKHVLEAMKAETKDRVNEILYPEVERDENNGNASPDD